ncbi:hypothetical protein HGM15179_019181 [Zosterops borbonicus]|uniref:RNase H type-1 domain-containing protein n=1 Tax=Zosterops borbonicus TaxID=364589 RepID=A0A8K1DAE6_9PASS|nr:hypothetical protein HGM15179_019181 [Zosterops borbonicus]
MTVLVSHMVSAVLEVKGSHWLSPQQFLKYQAIMVEQDNVDIVVTNILNPASFLSGNQGELVHHSCLETIEATYSSCPDLEDTPLDDAETWFTDGSSYVISGKQHAGYVVTTSRDLIEKGPLPVGTSAQKVEIIVLTCVLELSKEKRINIYTDSRYAFGVVHAHGAIWKERGLLNLQGKNIKHAQEIMWLSEAVQMPEKVAIMHIKAHQVSSALEEGNELADREAKEAAKEKEILAAYEGVQAASDVIGYETQLLLAPCLPVLGWMFKGKVPSTHHPTDTTWSKWIALITQRTRIGNPNRPGILEVITNWPEGETFGLSSEEEEKQVTRAEEAPPYNELLETERRYALFTDGSCQIVGANWE